MSTTSWSGDSATSPALARGRRIGLTGSAGVGATRLSCIGGGLPGGRARIDVELGRHLRGLHEYRPDPGRGCCAYHRGDDPRAPPALPGARSSSWAWKNPDPGIDPRWRIDQQSRARDEYVVSVRIRLLVDSMNSLFRKPVVSTTLGGRGGGAATLTEFGAEVVHHYRAMERATRRAIAKDLASLERRLRSVPRRTRKRTPRP